MWIALLAATFCDHSEARVVALEARVAELDRSLTAARVDAAAMANAIMRARVITIAEPKGERRERYDPAGAWVVQFHDVPP